MLKEFKEFAMKGNVVDLAVAVIIGGAFGKIVTSAVKDVIMPPIGKALGGVNFGDLFVNLDSAKGSFTSLKAAQDAGSRRTRGAARTDQRSETPDRNSRPSEGACVNESVPFFRAEGSSVPRPVSRPVLKASAPKAPE